MQTLMCFKSQGGVGRISVSQPSHTLMPWWVGSHPFFGESFAQLKSLTGNHHDSENGFPASPRQMHHVLEQRPEQELATSENAVKDTTEFLILPDHKDVGDGHRIQCSSTIAPQSSSPPGSQGHIELGLGQSMIFSNYSYVDQYYGLLATPGVQPTGRMLLPLNITADGPIYVNAKQYNGIIRRRQARAKLEMKNRMVKVRKPYLHESRHLHAMRRARGCGGRFLNTKNEDGSKAKPRRPTRSLSPEVLQSDSGYNPRSSRMCSQEDSDRFQFIEHLRPSIFQPMIDGEHGGGIAVAWGAASDGCYELLKI